MVAGTDGDMIAVQRNEPDGLRDYQIIAISADASDTWVAYSSNPAEIGPILHNHDEYPIAAEVPPDWVLLVDNFSNFIVGANWPPLTMPESAYPKLVNLRTGETIRLGPFADESDDS